MAPLDDLNGDSVLAEFEAMIRGSGNIDPGNHLPPGERGLVPERRAVNWVNALAAIAREIEQRQGTGRAELLLRTIGGRMSRDLLTPLPAVRDEFEPAINRALSILDWGWVAVLDRQDTIVFEHRAPWPFEKRADQLPYVLEGFYTEILRRLADNEAMHVRLTGKRGGALVLKWLPTDEPVAARSAPTHASSIIVPAVPAAAKPAAAAAPEPVQEPTVAAPPLPDAPEPAPRLSATFRPAERFTTPSPAPVVDDRRLPPLSEPIRPMRIHPEMAAMPVTATLAKSASSFGRMPILLVAATVFIALFALGLITSTGDIVGGLLHRLNHPTAASAATGAMTSSLETRARGGDTDAQIRLGLQLADRGTPGPDLAGAASWFRAAAKTGSAEAQYDFAVMIAEGVGVKRDPVEAAILFMNAATTGFPLAEYRLGVAYQSGAGVSRDAASAAMWYERAARHGVSQAQVALGRLYAEGKGVAADPIGAYAWYRVAEENGDRDATAKRVAVYRALSGKQRLAARARATALIGEIGGERGLVRAPAHPTVDRLIAQLS
ncbi:MAG TPA: tetratricopeptide repeat protein [Stellaceae bacterium]